MNQSNKGIVVRFKLNTDYSEKESEFLKEHDCKIFSEINLTKTDFSEHEVPHRMFQYGSTYIGEIVDDETDDLVWAVLSKWKGVRHFTGYYDCLETLEQGL